MATQVLSVALFQPKLAIDLEQELFLVMTILLQEKSLVHAPLVFAPSCASYGAVEHLHIPASKVAHVGSSIAALP